MYAHVHYYIHVIKHLQHKEQLDLISSTSEKYFSMHSVSALNGNSGRAYQVHIL